MILYYRTETITFLFLICIDIGNLSKLRRTVANHGEGGRAQSSAMQSLNQKVGNINERTDNIEKRQKAHMQQDSSKKFDISPYFPLSSLALLEDFMSNVHNDFKEKKDAFEVYLNSIATMDHDMDTFSAALLRVLFTKDFIRDHRWPTSE